MTSYTYDRNGTQTEVKQADGTDNTCGTEGELRQIWQKTNGSSEKDWTYDAEGKLAKYDDGNGVVTIVWDGGDSLQERA